MTIAERTRHAGRMIARRLHVEPALDAYLASRVPYLDRRDAQDNRNIVLLIRFALHAASNCIDIGANRGAITHEIVAACPHGRHLAFEPLPDLAAELVRRFPEVEVQSVALTDGTGPATFLRVVEADGYSGLRPQRLPNPAWRYESVPVQTARLDDCLQAGYAPDFIKIDVEGAEIGVLTGGIETIRRHRPLIVFEHYCGAAGTQGSSPAQIWPLLTDAGLEILDIDGRGPYSKAHMEDVFWAGALWTWIARPSREG